MAPQGSIGCRIMDTHSTRGWEPTVLWGTGGARGGERDPLGSLSP